jgi:GT2 family glycosyltransferase
VNVASISVIVVTYNEEKHIRDCLGSLSALDYPAGRFEVLVVDASTDSTPRIVQEYPRVRLIRSEKGFSQQKNTALKSVAFNILAFTDADCLIPPNWLRVIDRAFRQEKTAAIGGNGYPPPGTRRFSLWTACVGHPAGGAVGFDANVKRDKNGISFVPGCNSVYRKEALLDVGGFDPEFYDGGEDVDISRRLREKGYYLEYIPDLTVYHKPRPTLKSFLKWNIHVGITKFNIRRPRLWQLVLQPSFFVWPLAVLAGFIFMPDSWLVAGLILAGFWLFYLVTLFIFARPYPFLIRRRRKIGVSLVAVLTIIPLLIYLRQVCINLGQIKKLLYSRPRTDR